MDNADNTVFAALPPIPERLSIAGREIVLTPLKVGELPAFARAIHPFAEKLSVAPDWLALLADEGEALLLTLSIASRQPLDWLQTLEIDEAIALAENVFLANADFFTRRVAPEVNRLAARLANSAMPMPSSA